MKLKSFITILATVTLALVASSHGLPPGAFRPLPPQPLPPPPPIPASAPAVLSKVIQVAMPADAAIVLTPAPGLCGCTMKPGSKCQCRNSVPLPPPRPWPVPVPKVEVSSVPRSEMWARSEGGCIRPVFGATVRVRTIAVRDNCIRKPEPPMPKPLPRPVPERPARPLV